MATNFSANQYENAFAGKRLQNWEIPATFKERPSPLNGYTKLIANDRGHLIDGIKRSKKCPWGGFSGTWDSRDEKNKRILKTEKHETLPVEGKADILTMESPHPANEDNSNDKLLSPAPQIFDEKNIGISKHIEETSKNEKNEENDEQSSLPIPKTAEQIPSPIE